ncbi:MAG: substrate-binding domain-containing protein [Turicibacter sp.]|nr:substrate-binding domain-containing protein [Turicibacter sp.]
MKKMKKFGFLALLLIMAVALVACGADDNGADDNGNGGDATVEVEVGAIAVVSREEGSGSRAAFEELVAFNLEEDGSDAMTADAIIQTGNGGVATAVAENEAAIGYISLTTLLDRSGDLVGLYIDGVAPTAENMLSGAYTLVRPFNFVYLPDEIGDVERAFIEFAQSADGLIILEDRGVIVDHEGAEPFDVAAHGSLSGSLLFGGSTSTEATATALAEEFMALFPGVDIQYSATGSGAGISGATDGTYALGFASREIRDTELETGINVVQYSVDGIVVAVNPASGVTGLTVAQLRAIYLGEVTDWADVQ